MGDELTVRVKVSTRHICQDDRFTSVQFEELCAFQGGETGSLIQGCVCDRATESRTQRMCRDDSVQSRQRGSRWKEGADSSDPGSYVLVSEVRSSHLVVGVPIKRDSEYIVRP